MSIVYLRDNTPIPAIPTSPITYPLSWLKIPVATLNVKTPVILVHPTADQVSFTINTFGLLPPFELITCKEDNSNWILATHIWRDIGIWDDAALWAD